MMTIRGGDTARERPPIERERVRGALIGLAVGDALGTTLEFRGPGTFAPIDDMIGGGPFGLEPGEWTDDTSMALCIAESLLERRAMDLRDQMERFVRWRSHGHLSCTGQCFDIGNTVRRAIDRYLMTSDPRAGSADPLSAGNGSIMRLAPVAMFHVRDAAAAIEACGESSRTTHQAAVAVDACRYLGALLVGAMRGTSKDELLGDHYTPAPGSWDRAPLDPVIAAIAGGSFRRKQPPEIRGTGYAAASLEAALWAFHTTDDFRSGCLRAANLGDDADTTAAVFGQLAGAFYGEGGIPGEWRERLAMRQLIEDLADRLATMTG